MKMTLKTKMNMAILAAFVLIAILFVAIELPFQKQRIQTTRQNVILVLETMIERDLEALANEIFDESIRSINIRLDDMMEVNGVLGIHVFNAQGARIAARGLNYHEPGTPATSVPQDRAHSRITNVEINGKNAIDYLRQIIIIGEPIGFIRIFYSLEQVETELKRSFLLFAGLLSTVFIVLTLLSNLILSRTLINPVTDLRDAMERIRTQGTSEQVSIRKNDEIGDLAAAFNQMSTELTQSCHALEEQNQALLASEKEIHRTRQYLENIIDSMPSILAGVDIKGRITQWNAKAEAATGLPAEKVKGLHYSTVFPWVDVLPETHIKNAIELQEVITESRIISWADGQHRCLDITVFPLTQSGRLEAVLRVDDVTELFKMEEMIIQSEKMLSVGGLAAGMAHEINNPLAGMIQTADVLKNRLFEDVPATLQAAGECGIDIRDIRRFLEKRQVPRLLENIHASGVIAAGIVRNMLSFARKNESGKIACSIAKLLDQAISLARSEYNLKKKYDFKLIRIDRNYETQLPDILCEPGQIQQVILNILTNGAQAMFEHKRSASKTYDPRITIRVCAIENQSCIRIEITDNGPGMAEQTRKRVFEPFFTTKEQGEGTGLGLSVSYFIIKETHGGDISVESSPGAGTCFTITLPAAPGTHPLPSTDQ